MECMKQATKAAAGSKQKSKTTSDPTVQEQTAGSIVDTSSACGAKKKKKEPKIKLNIDIAKNTCSSVADGNGGSGSKKKRVTSEKKKTKDCISSKKEETTNDPLEDLYESPTLKPDLHKRKYNLDLPSDTNLLKTDIHSKKQCAETITPPKIDRLVSDSEHSGIEIPSTTTG